MRVQKWCRVPRSKWRIEGGGEIKLQFRFLSPVLLDIWNVLDGNTGLPIKHFLMLFHFQLRCDWKWSIFNSLCLQVSDLQGVPDETISQYVYFLVYVSFYFPCHWMHFAFWALFIGSFLWYSVVVMPIAEILVIYNTRPDLQRCLYCHCISSHINTQRTPCCQNNKKCWKMPQELGCGVS